MSDKAKPPETFNPRRFRSNVPFYARYRLPYPETLVARAAVTAGLRPGDPVMDLGCGPGLLAIPFARLGMAVTAVDPEPEMLEACGAAAREAGVAIDLKLGSSYDLPEGSFRLVTMGRSFHWMDREATLAALDGQVMPGGALAFFDDEHLTTSENAWRRKVTEVGERYGRNNSPHLVERRSEGFRSHHAILMDSPFRRLTGISEFVRREITTDEVIGLSLSLSTSSPEFLGEKRDAFEADLREELTKLSPEGRFTELAEMSALIASRD